MKKLFINSLCLLVAVLCGVGLFVLKYQVKEQESILKGIHKDILKNKRELHMLEAEWAHLNDPERLQNLVMEQTNWQSIQAEQLIKLDDIPLKSKGVVLGEESPKEVVPNSKKESFIPTGDAKQALQQKNNKDKKVGRF